ncbi:hypothetical protein CARUB_v10016409mg, partial [Capsella rubella]
IEDNYGGVYVNLTEPMTIEDFVPKLRASLVEWKIQEKKGIWIKLADGLDNLIAPAKTFLFTFGDLLSAQGFVCHHAEKEYTMLTSWISELPNTLPANASHRIVVGGYVLNKKTKEVLVVHEIDGPFKDTGVWKLHTGVIEEGENVWEGSLREVEEVTGLEPITFEIKKQDSEILDAKWMPIEEYVNQPWNQNKEFFKFLANICLKRSQEMEYMGFSTVRTTTSTGRESYIYCNTDQPNLLNATRDLASTSTPTSH